MRDSLGLDFGNVIINHVEFGTTDEYVDNGDYTKIPPVPGMIEAIATLGQGRFKGNMFVLYNASNVADSKILAWLEFHDFYARTGILPEHVRRSNRGRDKLEMCRNFKAEYFVDDRLEVLGHLVYKVTNLYLFRPQAEEMSKYRETRPHVQQVNSAEELLRIFVR
jgi:hypothetical protein